MRIEFSTLETKEKPKIGKECKGLIFRHVKEAWVGTQNDVNFTDRFRFLKSMSCEGCNKCEWLWDDLHETICSYLDGYSHIELGDKPGKLFQLRVVDYWKDWETGICEDWTLGFVEVKEKNDNTVQETS